MSPSSSSRVPLASLAVGAEIVLPSGREATVIAHEGRRVRVMAQGDRVGHEILLWGHEDVVFLGSYSPNFASGGARSFSQRRRRKEERDR